MADVEVLLPKMGESVAEATITAWLKEVGDTIEEDEPIVEIATDKVDSEVPAPASPFPPFSSRAPFGGARSHRLPLRRFADALRSPAASNATRSSP